MQKLLSFLFLALLLSSCETRSTKAVNYNDSILTYQSKISHSFSSLDSALNTYDEREMEYAQKILDAEIITGQRLLDTIGPFREDSTLLIASRELFDFYEYASENSYPLLMEILLLPDSEYTRADQARAYELDSLIRKEFHQAHDRFVEQQQVFWERYNIVAGDD